MTRATHPRADYVSVAEVAQTLGFAPQTVYRMCRSGKLPYIRTGAAGTTYRIPREAVEAHLATSAVTPPAPVIPGQTDITE